MLDVKKELLAEWDRETATTRKVLEAIPADADLHYKPHEKSMSLGRLAAHIVETFGGWTVGILNQDALIFPADHKFGGPVAESRDALLADFDKAMGEARAALANFAPEDFEKNWKFGVGDQIWIDGEKYAIFRQWVLDHGIHHRAQLGVYLRLLNVPLPGVYGPSADSNS